MLGSRKINLKNHFQGLDNLPSPFSSNKYIEKSSSCVNMTLGNDAQ